MSLSVIGAGLPRTGTMSQKLALEELGFGPCYHMTETFPRPEHWPLWETAAVGGPVDWNVLFEGWASTTDAPGCNFYRELANYFPDAKVVLSVRDPEAWFASTQATIVGPQTEGFHGARGTLPMIEAIGWGTDPRLRDHDWMIARYHRHNDEVKDTIPADRLLIYDVAEGWEPLCRFLGRPIPDMPFPKSNSTVDFKEMIKMRQAEAEAANAPS